MPVISGAGEYRGPVITKLFNKKDWAIFGDLIYTDARGNMLTKKQWYSSIKRNESVYDRLTLEMCTEMRGKKEPIPDWLMNAERSAWERSR